MTNWYEVEFVLLKQLGITPLELDQLEFYRIEYLMDNFKDYSEKKNKQRETQEQSQKFDQSSILKNSQSSFKKYLSQNQLKGLK